MSLSNGSRPPGTAVTPHQRYSNNGTVDEEAFTYSYSGPSKEIWRGIFCDAKEAEC